MADVRWAVTDGGTARCTELSRGVGAWMGSRDHRSAEGNAARDVLLVAEDDSGVLSALVSGTAAGDDPWGSIAEIEATNRIVLAARC